VTAQLGHTKPTTTLNHYTKWLPSEKRRYVNLVDKARVDIPAEEDMKAV